jgi:hypothetical protein
MQNNKKEREDRLLELLQDGNHPLWNNTQQLTVQYMFDNETGGIPNVLCDTEYNRDIAECCMPAIREMWGHFFQVKQKRNNRAAPKRSAPAQCHSAALRFVMGASWGRPDGEEGREQCPLPLAPCPLPLALSALSVCAFCIRAASLSVCAFCLRAVCALSALSVCAFCTVLFAHPRTLCVRRWTIKSGATWYAHEE